MKAPLHPSRTRDMSRTPKIAVLLAGGRSRRMGTGIDKNFLVLGGKFLIQRQLEVLLALGFAKVFVVGGGHNQDLLQMVIDHCLANEPHRSIALMQSGGDRDGVAGSILGLRELIGTEPFLLCGSSDIVGGAALERLLDRASESDAASLLLVARVQRYFPGGYVEVDSQGSLRAIIEKPGAGNEPSDLVTIFVHVHMSPAALFEALDSVGGHQGEGRYEAALTYMVVEKRVRIEVVSYGGYWQPIKELIDAERAAHDFESVWPYSRTR